MKRIIATLIRTGITTSKKPIEDLIKYLYPLRYIITLNSAGLISCNTNPFWKKENSKNITELYRDILAISKHSITDSGYFKIINRFENGDKYGIVIE